MKYYKLLTKEGYRHFKVGKIYKDIDVINISDPVEYCVRNYPSDWQEVPAGDYFVQENKLPECFRVKMIKHPLREKYVEWWKNEFNSKCYYEGALGRFYGFNSYDRTTLSNAAIDINIPENAIELTLEQWDKIVNKNTMEEKEIIGYKLKEECKHYRQAAKKIVDFYNPNNPEQLFKRYFKHENKGWYIDKLKEAGVLDLWFEPVYKAEIPDIKADDYIYMIDACGADKENYHKYNGDVLKVTSFKKENNNLFPDTYWLEHTPRSFSGGGFRVDESAWEYGVHFRKATTEEIKKATTLTFGGYDVTFEKVSSGVRITCNGETGTLSQMQKIFDFITGFPTFKFGSQRLEKIEFPNVNVHLDNLTEKPLNIKIGCIYGTWEEFCNILEAAKKLENE